jgi:hypothetical protein
MKTGHFYFGLTQLIYEIDNPENRTRLIIEEWRWSATVAG